MFFISNMFRKYDKYQDVTIYERLRPLHKK